MSNLILKVNKFSGVVVLFDGETSGVCLRAVNAAFSDYDLGEYKETWLPYYDSVFEDIEDFSLLDGLFKFNFAIGDDVVLVGTNGNVHKVEGLNVFTGKVKISNGKWYKQRALDHASNRFFG